MACATEGACGAPYQLGPVHEEPKEDPGEPLSHDDLWCSPQRRSTPSRDRLLRQVRPEDGPCVPGHGGKYVHYQCRVYHEDSLRHVCLSLTGKPVERAVARRVVEVLNRENIDRALEIVRQAEKCHHEDEREWRLKIEAAEYEAQRAFRHYDAVEPENRLVARSLGKAWEEKLEEVGRLKEEFARWSTTNPSPVKKSEHQKLLTLLEDFQQVWDAPTTRQQERKALLRILVQDVTLEREGREIVVGIRWQSGMTEVLRVNNHNAPSAMMVPAVLERIRRLSPDHLDSEIAAVLTREGYRSARNRQFTAGIVRTLRQRAGIKKSHAGEPGYYTPPQLLALLGVSDTTVVKWCRVGKLEAHRQGRHSTWWIKLSCGQILKLRRELAAGRR